MIGLSIGIRAGARGAAAVPATPAVFTMTQLAQGGRIYQRDTLSGGGPGKGRGSVPVTMGVTTAGTLYARCRSAADGTTIVQAPWLAIGSVTTGAGVRSIGGIDARLGFFHLDLSGDGVTWTNGTTAIGMGALVAMAGQSLMGRMFHKYTSEDTTTIGGAGASVPANGRLFAAVDTAFNSVGSGASQIPTTWSQPSDATADHAWSAALNGAGAAELMNRLIALAGVNVGLVAKVEGATAIAEWQPGQPLGDALAATLDAAGGKFEAVIWYQGHTDSSTGRSYSYYRAQLDTLFAAIGAHNSFAAPARIVASIPNIASTNWGTVAAKETIRRAAYDWAGANGVIAVQMNDIALGGDGVHALQIGAVRQAAHFYRALRPHFGAAHDDRGATLGTPTHAGGSRAIVIPFTLPSGASGLAAAGAPATRFKVYKRGLRSGALAFDAGMPFAIDNGARTITLTLAADPGPIPLDILPFGPNDPANDGPADMVADDLTDGDGLAFGRQMQPGAAALHVAVNHDLTITGGSYGAGRFGTTLTGGSGVTATAVMPALAEGFRLEAWLRVDAPDAGLKVACGAGEAAWIGCQGNDLKCFIGGSSGSIQTFANTLPTGAWRHIALTCDAPGLTYTVHVDGVQQGAAYAVTSDYDGSSHPFGVRGFGDIGGFELTTQSIDEVAIWRSVWPAGIVPGAAYGGSEAGLLALWRLDGNGANSAGG